MKKRILIAVIAVCVLVATGGGLFFAFRSRAPKVEDIYDRVVELVEASYDLNTVFYGAGLPVYRSDSEYAEFTHMYYDFAHKGTYEYVTPQAQFFSEQQIRDAAERVYSKEYLEKVIYPAIFVGYAINDGMGDAAYAYARYMQEYDSFYQYSPEKGYINGMRVYDYSTMKVVKPSKADACYVEMLSWMENEPESTMYVKLRLVLQDDGQWYLDDFSG